MAIFALVHGSGDSGWAWHLVRQALQDRGHEAVAPDLPTDREGVTWGDCVDVVADEVADAASAANAGAEVEDVVVVGHSAGGFVLPLAADRLGARLQVYVAAMVPQPGESASAWFGNVGWADAVAEQAGRDCGRTGSDDPMVGFFHDVPADLAAEAIARERPTVEALGNTPWPGSALPAVPARYVVTSQDRFLPASVQRHVAQTRLDIDAPCEIDAGHCVNLSRPAELAELLVALL